MKIATMVRGYIPAPRPADMLYAPIDLAVEISEGLAKLGHSVDFFGPKGSHLRHSNVVTLGLRPIARNHAEFRHLLDTPDLMNHYTPGLWDYYMAREMFERASRGEYDLLHFHHPEAALPFVRLYPDVPVVYTLHEVLSPLFQEVLEMYDSPNQYYISISNNQQRLAPQLPYAETVYNGIDTKLFKYSATHDNYLLFAARIVPDKGVKEAIQVAQRTGDRLLIIGPTYPDQRTYFDRYVKPHLGRKIKYLGFVPHEELPAYYQKAKAFLMPVRWEEPFGMTMAEAMSCGTPVIAFRRGSICEVVKDKQTGFIVDTVSQMAKAVQKVESISRQACHEHATQNFSFERMAAGYEAAFQKILAAFRATQISPELLRTLPVKKHKAATLPKPRKFPT